MTACDETPNEGKNLANSTNRNLSIETVDGELAATVTITGLGHQASSVIVEQIEEAIRTELEHLVRER